MPGFVFTSDDPPRPGWFSGYCFVGADYVFGEAGSREFERARGVTITGGEDGCYANARTEGDGVRFSCDFGGYMNLWYYQTSDFWLVSSSIALAVQQLWRRGKAPQPNRAQLSRMRVTSHHFNQQCSLASIVEGLHLVPMGCDLLISRNGCALQPRAIAETADYRGCVTSFCNSWLSRNATLLTHPRMKLSINLSGGRDSRATFALAERARRELGVNSRAQMAIKSNRTRGRGPKVDRDDLAIANLISAALGVSLNGDLGVPRPGGEAAFSTWYQTSLGCYDVVHLPISGLDPFEASIGGGGGGSNRIIYANQGVNSVDDLVRRYHKKLADKDDARALEAEVRRGMEMIQGISPAGSDPIMLYYCHFRARFHGGRKPQTSVSFTPLASKGSLACQRASSASMIEDSQLHYDVYHSIMPALIEIPFDFDHKAPSARVRRSTVNVSSIEISPGQIFGDSSEASGPRERRTRNTDVFAAALRLACRSDFAATFLGRDFLDETSRLMEAAVQNRKFEDPFFAKPVASVLACAMFDMPELTEAAIRGEIPSD